MVNRESSIVVARWQSPTSGGRGQLVTIHGSRFTGSLSLGLALLLGRLLVARERVRDQLLYLVLDLVELHLGGLLELLDRLGARLLDLLREPVLLGEVEAADAEDDDGDDDAEEHVAEVVDVADQVVDGAVEDEARPREREHP